MTTRHMRKYCELDPASRRLLVSAIERLGLSARAYDRILKEPPDEWRVVLDAFAENPSLERWRELMQFVPDDLLYQRHRNGIRYLKKHGVEANLLFLCACYLSITPDAIELVEEGLVSVETLQSRANEAGEARGAYIGLAAQTAFLAGDLLGTIRLLREAMSLENEWISALPHVWFVWERATTTERDALDRAGIPRP